MAGAPGGGKQQAEQEEAEAMKMMRITKDLRAELGDEWKKLTSADRKAMVKARLQQEQQGAFTL